MPYDELEDGKLFGIQRNKINTMFAELYSIKIEASQVLTRVNTSVFTPTADYHPATKIYADQLRTNWNTVYDPDDINANMFDRANHTGTQAPSTITTDSTNRFITDAERTLWNQKEDAIGVKNTAFNKNFGTTSGTVSEGSHTHTKADLGLGSIDNTSDVNKPISTLQQAALDLKQNAADLGGDVEDIVEGNTISFSKYRITKSVVANYSVLLTDDTLVVAATTSDITITLPLLSSLVGKPYQVLEIIPIVVGSYKVRIKCAGADTFPFGNTYFDLPSSQKQFAIGLHEHGFNLRRNISVGIVLHMDTDWNSSNFDTFTAIPWETEQSNSQSELMEWSSSDAGKIHVRTKGTYTLSGGFNMDPVTVQAWQVECKIYVNGIAISHMYMIVGGSGNNKDSLYASTPIELEADDYVEMRLEHSLTAAVNITSAQIALGVRL